MSENVDENLLTIAKLSEQIRGELDGGRERIQSHAGLVDDDRDRRSLSFVSEAIADSDRGADRLEDTELGETLLTNAETEAATRAVNQGHTSLASFLVGVTEQELDASNVTLPSKILARIVNDGQLSTMLAAGAPNSGKTNTVWLCCEIADAWFDDLLVISNARAEIVDRRVTSAHDLAVTLLEERDRPKVVVIDEGSTHFDARTQNYEVASQWSPLLKRMSKLGCELVAVIGHTGKDVDPEVKRLTNLALFKSAPERAEFFAEWPADSDFPDDRLFGGTLDELEATSVDYDPDEPAPWSWDLEADLFGNDLDWPDLLDELERRGPAE